MTDTSSSYLEAQARRIEMEERLAALERATASASGAPGWATAIQFQLNELRGALADHVRAVEAADGLLAEILDAAPRLSNLVALLKEDHGRLSQEIESLSETATRLPADGLRERVMELMRHMVVHRQRGSDLVYEAFARDIGGPDG